MTENQKLREAFESYITDDGKWPNAILKAPGGQYLLLRTSVAWQDWEACAEALALPTAAPVGELPDPAEYFVFAGLDWHRATAAYFNSCSGEKLALYTADQMRAYARAALSAGDAVDGPLIDEGSKPALSPLSDKDAIALIEEHTNDDNVIHAHEAIELIRSVERAHGIDASMRKGQL